MDKKHSFVVSIKKFLRSKSRIIDEFGKRFTVFRKTAHLNNFLQPCFYLFTNRHIRNKGKFKSNYGVWLYERPDDITYSRCLKSDYFNELDRILKSVSDDSIFVDIGANLGIFSPLANRNSNFKEIFAFEPIISNFHFLEKNIQINQANRVRALPYAVGPNSGNAEISIHEGHSGRSRIGEKSTGKIENIEMIDEKFFDSILAKNYLPLVVKIDVEGFEFQVLKTLEKSKIFNQINHLHLEFDLTMGEVSNVEQFLSSKKFLEVARWGDEKHWDSYWKRADRETLST